MTPLDKGTRNGKSAFWGLPGEIPKSTLAPENPLLGGTPCFLDVFFSRSVSGSPPGSILGRFWEAPTPEIDDFIV